MARGIRHSLASVLAITVAAKGGLDCALALDGKSATAHRTTGESDRCLVAAVEHGAGVVRGQVSASGFAGSEIVAARQLIDELDVAGRRLTLDTLHSCRKTAELIVARQADYTSWWSRATSPPCWRTCRRFDGTPRAVARPSTRATAGCRSGCAMCLLRATTTRASWRCRAAASLSHRARTNRAQDRQDHDGNGIRRHFAYGVTSLSSDMAGPSEVLARGRGHWEIENRVHYVRDFSYDEDRGRIRKGRLSRNLACLTNAAISIVRFKGRFRHQPQRRTGIMPPRRTRLCTRSSRRPTNPTHFVRDYARPSG